MRMECYPPNINRRILPYFDTCFWIISFEFIVEVHDNDLYAKRKKKICEYSKNSTLLI